ncbi:ABC di/oligopeptide transporter inner membrane subunit [Primorskyibacter flagellatus]|uniref:ABC di/oligopeptide transporter inner membrane subunit n=1 Tax=Primorskyibacter flagellatus TaxID=1387277 RepID=A0A917AHL9_9RHOB|nr:ABC transporter permease [Primorskyibacter flagellatus]GGE51282.1 ABC di/oligopeptide transporter inner membrane subunit [Primorskyibacter flagellatus]
MLKLIAFRIAQAIPVMLVVAVLTFLLMHLLPGDPATIIAGDQADQASIDQIRRDLGLDRPVPVQLWHWIVNLAQGDFGRSLMLNQAVADAVKERLPVTLSLAMLAFAITLPFGIAFGVIAAVWRDTWVDSAVMILALVGVSVPNFWIAILSVILFSVTLGWLPSAGYVPLHDSFSGWLASLIQPAVVLALFQIGYLARMTRSAMLDVLDQDYIRTARAKGVAVNTIIVKHAFRNTLMQVVTVAGYILSLLIGGSVVIEQIFALPGIGRLLVQAIMARDYPVVQGTMLLLGFAFVFINILIDLIYAYVDPRVRYD